MKIQAPVSQIMTPEPIYAEADNTFSQARDLFLKFKIHHLPVVKDGNPIGIISTIDILKAYTVAGQKKWECDDVSMNKKLSISDVMTDDPVNISPATSLQQAIRVFQESNFQALLVVEFGKLVGILTLKDIVSQITD